MNNKKQTTSGSLGSHLRLPVFHSWCFLLPARSSCIWLHRRLGEKRQGRGGGNDVRHAVRQQFCKKRQTQIECRKWTWWGGCSVWCFFFRMSLFLPCHVLRSGHRFEVEVHTPRSQGDPGALPWLVGSRSDCPSLMGHCWPQTTGEWSWSFKITNTWPNSCYSYLFPDFLSSL